MKLDPSQERAVELICTGAGRRLALVTGGPGTGKTTSLRAALDRLDEAGTAYVLASPTGKAARRMMEATGREAATLHRTLEWFPREQRFLRDERNPIEADVIVVDEASMLDIRLMESVCRACAKETRLVLIGDRDQLPPVGAGCPFADLIRAAESGVEVELGGQRTTVPVARLTTLHRAAAESWVCSQSPAILAGRTPDLRERPDFLFLEREVRDEAVSALVGLVVRELPNAGSSGRFGGVDIDPNAIQVLIPQNVGPAGAGIVNARLQALLNGSVGGHNVGWKIGGQEIRRGDRVIQTKNAYDVPSTSGPVDVMNGETGTVLRVQSSELVVRFDDGVDADGRERWREAVYDRDKASKLRLAYALSTHKCVHPETLVETPYGMMPIDELPAVGRIATADGERPYLNKVENPAGRLLRITTEDGYELRVTPEHGLMVWTGERYERQEAQDIEIGSFLRFRLGATCEPPTPTLPSAPSVDVRAKLYRFPATVTTQVAEFFGLTVGDGTVFDHGIRLAKRHVEVTHRFASLAREIFGAEPKHAKAGNAYAAEVHSVQIAEWLRSVGGMAPNAKGVPACILRAPAGIQAAFLRGLFEDGTVNVKMTSDRLVADHVEWSTSNEVLARHVQTMLLRQGIVSSRQTFRCGQGKRFFSHRVYIYGSFISRYAERIGFISGMKHARLGLPLASSTRYRIPVARDLLTLDAVGAEGNARSIVQNGRHRGYVSRDSAQHVPALQDALRFHHSRIARVEEDFGPSMCVEVPGVHRFLQNGCDGSNSQGSEWPWVVLLAHSTHTRMLSRNLLYTAITRAKRGVVIVGDRKGLAAALANTRDAERNTGLVGRLTERRAA